MIPDQMLAEALAAENERRLNAYLTELQERPAFPLSGRAEKRLLRVLSDLQRSAAGGRIRRPEGKKLVRALLIAALLIALLLAAIFVSAMSQRQMQVDGGFVEIVFPKAAGRHKMDASFSEIPDGFVLVEKKQSKLSIEYRYQRGEDLLIVCSEKAGGMVVFDMDDFSPVEISINGYPAYYCISDTVINLVWSTGNIDRRIMAERSSGMTIEDVVKIAQSFED